MGPKMARKIVRKIEFPKDNPTELEFADTAADIQGRKEEREQREREEAKRAKTPQSQMEEAVAEKGPRTERSDSEMDTEGGGEASASTEYQSWRKKRHLTNI